MTPDWIKVYLEFVVLVAAIGSWVYVWVSNRNRARQTEVDALQKRAERQRRDIDRVAQRIDNVPAKEDVHALQLAIAEVKGEMGALNQTIKPIGHALRRLEDYLLKVDAK